MSRDELLRKREARDAGEDPYARAAEPDETAVMLEVIRMRAEQVACAHDAFQEAIMKEQESATELLVQAIEHARPALRALVGKIETASTKVVAARPGGGVSVQQTSESHYPLKGVMVVDKLTAIDDDVKAFTSVAALGVSAPPPGQITGQYGGQALYLLENGELVLGRRSGTWSKRPGDATSMAIVMDPIAPAKAVQKFRIELILSGLIDALESQSALAGRAVHVHERASRLVAALAAVNDFMAEERA